MTRWYVGSGVFGFRRWVFAKLVGRLLLAHVLPSRVVDRLDPGLPDGYEWYVRMDNRGFYTEPLKVRR